MSSIFLTTSLLAADQSLPSAEFLEFLADSAREGKEWVDPLTIQEMEDSDTSASQSTTVPAPRGQQP